MATPVVAGCLQTALVHNAAGQIAENVLHWNAPDVTDAASMTTALAAIATAWEDNVLPFLSTDTTFIRIDGVMLNGPGSIELSYSVPGSPAGDGGGVLSSQEQSFCLTKSGGVSGRVNRGRLYVVGVPSAEISEGNINVTWGNNVRDGLNSFAAQVVTGGGPAFVILSRKDLEMKPFSQFTVHDYFVDVQRRRLPGHNRHH
jgi:hypothetical protein